MRTTSLAVMMSAGYFAELDVATEDRVIHPELEGSWADVLRHFYQDEMEACSASFAVAGSCCRDQRRERWRLAAFSFGPAG